MIDAMQHPRDFKARIERECLTESAIDAELYRSAVSFVEDTGFWEPNRELGHKVSTQWQTRQPHSFGELACFYQEDGSLWQAKAENPRKLPKKGRDGGIKEWKASKYEAPKGAGSKPYLPPIPGSIRRRIAERYGCDVPTDGPFWDWLSENPSVPVVCTEGAKKALSLLSQGYVAISLYGVYGGVRSKDALGYPVKPHLIPELEQFCQVGRRVFLAFDQDAEAKTRRKVNGALFRFGGLLGAAGCTVRLSLWDGQQGKGVDDLIANAGPDAFHRTVDQALTLDEYRLKLALDNRLAGLTPALRINTADLSQVQFTAPDSGIIAISSAKGTGKTKAIASMVEGDDSALLLGHRIALTRNLCHRLGIRYRGDLDKHQGRFHDGEAYVLRVGGCVDGTLLAINPADFEGCDLVLDEVVQVLRHLLTSSTCNKNGARPVLLARFAELVKAARRVILADADLDKASIQYIQALRGDNAPAWMLLNDAKIDPWPVEFIETSDASAITAQLLADVADGNRVFVATDSKAGSKRLDRLISQVEGIGHSVLLLNSETSGGEIERGVIEQPNQVEAFSVVIASPSLGTGWSDESQHFDKVYGVFWGASSTDADMSQALARVRRPVPRVVWCSERGSNFSRVGRDTNPLRLKDLLKQKTDATAQLTAASLGALGAEISGYDWTNPHLDLWATIEAQQNRSMLALRSALKIRLIHEGHQVNVLRQGANPQARDALRDAKLQIDIMAADAVAAAADITSTQAKALESCEALTPDERLALHKWRLAQFYALPTEDITPDLVYQDRDGRRRSQLLNLENFLYPDVATDADVKRINSQAQWNRGITPWDIPNARLRSELRHRLRLAAFLEDGKVWTSADLEEFKSRCLKHAREIKAALNITIRPDMTAQQMLGQLLDQVGLSTESQQFRGNGERRRRYYLDQQVKADALDIISRRAQRRQAAQQPPVTPPPICSDESLGCDTSEPPEIGNSWRGRAVRWRESMSPWLVEAVNGDLATIRIQNPFYQTQMEVPISELKAA